MKSFYIKISSVIFALLFSMQAFGAILPPTVDNNNDSGLGSLRAAIIYANAHPGYTIVFSASFAGIINLVTPLDTIKSTTIIDGTTAPGYNSTLGIPGVSIKGVGVRAGLVISATSGASFSIIKAIQIEDNVNSSVGIDVIGYDVNGATNVTIIGCYLFTDFSSPNKDGFRPADNAALGIRFSNCFGGVIGGATPDSANIINCQLPFYFVNTNLGKARGNFLNTDKSGNTPSGTNPGTFNTGFSLFTATNLIIEQNTIGYVYTAINLSGGSNSNVIRNNYIGTNAAGTLKISNGQGIWFSSGTNNYNTITSNIIANSTGGGAIYMFSTGVNNTISQNSFYCNAGVGYSGGWNNSYTIPAFTKATYTISAGSITVSGTSSPYDLIEFFLADPCSGSEGKTYIGSTNAGISGTWSASLPFALGGKITATATNTSNKSTSGFATSANVFDCSAVSANAGSDTTMCTGTNFYLNGKIINADSLIWTTSGTGKFADSSYYKTSYTPSSTDIAAGSVTITLKTLAGTCAAIATNHMVLSFAKSRIANAGGPNQTGCLTGGVQLNGTLYNTTKGGWSGGSGTYIPNDSTPNARYIPGSGDIIDGTHAASLTFTPAGNPLPGCANISDQVHVYFEIPVTVTASVYSTNTICKDSLQLIASLNKNVTTATWSSSSNHGKFYPSIAVPSGSPYNYYTPVSADYAAGSVYLILTGTVPLSIGCPTVKDSILINLVKPPTVFAGHDTTVCTLSPIVLQHATVTGTTSIQWTTTGGGGFLPHDTTLATTYYPNANGEAASIYIILTTMKGCSTAVDSILVNFVTAPVAKASQSGNNKLLCQGDTIKLNGLVSASVPFNWSTNGTGQFLPDATTLNAAYVPSKADIKKVAIGITLTANLPGCPITKNELLAVILPPPDAGQGTKQQLCPDNSITLSALDPGTDQTGTWTRIAGSGRIVSPGQATTLIDSISVDVNTYKWTVRDTSTGCTNSTIYTVDYCFQPEVTVYNVVSPNNDGMNEFLELENIETYKKNKVIIYNRGGDVVFQMDDYDNAEKVFKGKSNVGFNRDLQDGVYYYLISKGNGGKTQKGFLVLRNDK